MPSFRAAAASGFLVLTIATAQAGPAVRVNFRDLDLSNPADSQTLVQRVQAAAEEACGPARYSSDTRFSALTEADSDHRACVRHATFVAMARIQAVFPGKPR